MPRAEEVAREMKKATSIDHFYGKAGICPSSKIECPQTIYYLHMMKFIIGRGHP